MNSGGGFAPGNGGNGGGCCGGARQQSESLEALEAQLHALWLRVQEERAKKAQANEPVRKKGCCCG